ncbi:MAG TPA: chorismate synthase, partial [Candidatus Thermoplasmatota archaeon]|nr:chorismate synthase [Candidatus Thermoplasmatota archaeon]
MNAAGRRLRLSLFGESHGAGVGCVLDGVPPGLAVDAARVQADLDARRPGGPLASPRQEPDRLQVLSGLQKGVATGAPLALWIANEDARPQDAQPHLLRPGHADLTQHAWSSGHADLRGGGHASGRLTAPLVAAGAVAQALLDAHGIRCGAHLHEAGGVRGRSAPDAASMA